ncbi:hypothetical protein [Streptomyces sp. MK37H]|uniref:hypothetical protein n=1 Tax=Streptomyces sp. MK37H TaxID=2699117 RepID=UPI001B397C01|nr:hypothetical protein [Streptomyces sp. MK37H]MBP8538487.1 hypothetical protein [Streptomyces sp. MK37H]
MSSGPAREASRHGTQEPATCKQRVGASQSGTPTQRAEARQLLDQVPEGFLYNDSGQLNLDRGIVERNTATGFGGGIDNQSGGQVTLINTKVIDNTPDNCAPEGSVPGCANPTAAIDPPPTRELLPDDDVKDPE